MPPVEKLIYNFLSMDNSITSQRLHTEMLCFTSLNKTDSSVYSNVEIQNQEISLSLGKETV